MLGDACARGRLDAEVKARAARMAAGVRKARRAFAGENAGVSIFFYDSTRGAGVRRSETRGVAKIARWVSGGSGPKGLREALRRDGSGFRGEILRGLEWAGKRRRDAALQKSARPPEGGRYANLLGGRVRPGKKRQSTAARWKKSGPTTAKANPEKRERPPEGGRYADSVALRQARRDAMR